MGDTHEAHVSWILTLNNTPAYTSNSIPQAYYAVDKNSTGGGLVRGPRLSHSLMNQFPLTGGPGIDSFAGFFPGLYLELNI